MPRVREPRRRGSSGSRGPWVIAAIVAFLIADIALVGFAMSTTRAAPITTLTETLPTFSATPGASATPSPTAMPATVSPASFLVATSTTTAWRATAGLCGVSDPVIQSTTDAGVTWTPHSLSNQEVHEIVALSATTGDAATIVAKTGADCLVTAVSTFTAGQFWQAYPERLVDQSFISPTNSGVLQLQGSAMNAPCPEVLGLDVGSSRPTVLCSDAISMRSATTTEWVTTSAVGAKAFTVNGSRVLVAVAGVAGCAGIAMHSFTLPLTAAATPTHVGCAAAASQTGPAALDESGEAVWLTADGVTTVSTDGGSTW